MVGSGFALAQGAGSSPLDGGDEDTVITQTNVTLSEQEAIDIATAEASGTVEKVEFESEDDAPAYEVELVASNGSETGVTVHANDGTVLETESAEDDEDAAIAQTNVTLSEQEAIDTATAEASGTVKKVELESEDGTPAYEVELVASNGSETEVTVHANDGTVLETESAEDEEIEEDGEMEEDDEMEDNEFVASDTVSLSEQEAIDTATAEASGTVEEVELESEDGTPVYEVELVASGGSETEVAIHADDGTVLNTETEDE